MDLVHTVLEEVTKKEAQYKSTEVHKDIENVIDEGNLLSIDVNAINSSVFKQDKEAFIKNLTRDNTQLLFNNIWKLPVERVEDTHVVKMPELTFVLPREKPVPKPKKPTKWEEYAKAKGITKKKKGRLVWDEASQDWKPRWGYGRVNNETKQWCLEVPQSADPYEDQFAKVINAKKERIAKNELQRLRNIARHKGKKVPGVGLTPTERPDDYQLTKAAVEAKRSTASMGKFTNTLSKEKKVIKNTGKKGVRFSNMVDDRKRQLDVLKDLNRHKPIIDVNRAANLALHAEETSGQKSRKAPKPSKSKAKNTGGKKRKGGGGKGGKGGKRRK